MWRRWRPWVVVVVVACAVVRALLPWTVERTIEGVGGALVGRGVTVEDVDLEVLAGRVHVHGLRIGGPRFPGAEPAASSAAPGAPESPVVSVDTILTDLDWFRLLALEISFARIEASAPRVHIPVGPQGWPTPLVLEDHRPEWTRPWIARAHRWLREFPAPVVVRRLGVRDLRLALATDHGPVRGAVDARARGIAIESLRFEAGRADADGLELSNAKIAMNVQGLGADKSPVAPPAYPTVTLIEEIFAVGGDRIRTASARDVAIEVRRGKETLNAQVNGVLTNVVYEPGHPIAVEAEVALDDGSVRIKGRATPYPPAYSGALRWKALDLAALARFADLVLPVDLARGGSDGAMQADLSADVDSAVVTFEFAGDAEVREIDVHGEAATFEARVHRVILKARRLAGAVDWGPRELGPLEADFERVEIEQPEAQLDIPVLNLAQVDVADWIPADLEKLLADARMTVSELRVDGGTLDANDTSVEPAMHTKLSDVQLSVVDLRWPELDARRMHFSAKEAGGGGFDLAGSLKGGVGQMSGTISRIPLPGFSGYAVEISGFQLAAGDTSLDSNLDVEDKEATLQGTLTLHRLEIEAAKGLFAKVFGPPLKVGLSLLSDGDGNIRLPVVLKYDYGTKLSFWTIVWASLRASLQGGIDSALKGVVGPNGKIPPMPFPPGQAVLDDAVDERLAALARALKRHPDIDITFVGHTGPKELSDAGPEARNALALRRATALRERLLERNGTAPQRVAARAGGESAPEVTLQLSMGP